jgi:hypothetical protein
MFKFFRERFYEAEMNISNSAASIMKHKDENVIVGAGKKGS